MIENDIDQHASELIELSLKTLIMAQGFISKSSEQYIHIENALKCLNGEFVIQPKDLHKAESNDWIFEMKSTKDKI